MAFPVNSKPNTIVGGQVTDEDKIAFQGVSVRDRLKLVANQLPIPAQAQPRVPINPAPKSPNAPKIKQVAERQLSPTDLPPPFPCIFDQAPPADLPPAFFPAPIDLPPPLDLPPTLDLPTPALPVRTRRPLPSPVKDAQPGVGGDMMAELRANRVMRQRKEYSDQYVVGATKTIQIAANDLGYTFNEQAMTFTGPKGDISFSAFKALSLEKAILEPKNIFIAANALHIDVRVESVSREDLSKAFAEFEKAFNARVCNEIRQNAHVIIESAKQGYTLVDQGYFTKGAMVKTVEDFENDIATENFAKQLQEEENQLQLQAARNRNKSIGDQYGLTAADMLKMQEYVKAGYRIDYVGGYLSKGEQGEEGFMTFDDIKNEVRATALPFPAPLDLPPPSDLPSVSSLPLPPPVLGTVEDWMARNAPATTQPTKQTAAEWLAKTEKLLDNAHIATQPTKQTAAEWLARRDKLGAETLKHMVESKKQLEEMRASDVAFNQMMAARAEERKARMKERADRVNAPQLSAADLALISSVMGEALNQGFKLSTDQRYFYKGSEISPDEVKTAKDFVKEKEKKSWW